MNHHSNTVLKNWSNLSLAEQLAHVGSEVSRTIKWQNKDKDISDRAFERMSELLDATISCQTQGSKLKELTRVRELINASRYQESPVTLAEFDKYFTQFACLANKNKQSQLSSLRSVSRKH